MEKNNDLWCEYSDLPSPMVYDICMDYDGMGNQGRIGIRRMEKIGIMKKLIQKIVLWFELRSDKKSRRRSIWKLK
jgi:hypothetical protein